MHHDHTPYVEHPLCEKTFQGNLNLHQDWPAFDSGHGSQETSPKIDDVSEVVGKEEAAQEEEELKEICPMDVREDWETGRPDYLGKASWQFIVKRIEATTGKPKRPSDMTPSTEEDNYLSNRPEHLRDKATQTPTLGSPFDPALRRVIIVDATKGGNK